MNKYDPKVIEPKWQKIWADTKIYQAVTGDKTRNKFYMLTEFPYPSGAGLHAGHIREYTIGDVIARHKRMLGHNVLYPMGYDAFGLPTENYAIKHKIRPQDATAQNVATFREQFNGMGFSFDWDRQVNTTDPDYYRWTQWLFLRFFAAGLAYQTEMAINWCPKEMTGLANEEVVDGKHERCGTPVEKKMLKQWMLKITAYADRLIDGLTTVDYPSRIADQQVNWIGRSEGAEIDWTLSGLATRSEQPQILTVYTTRPDTLMGATFLVVSPEVAHSWSVLGWKAPAAVSRYVDKALRESELQRQEENKVKTGVDTGVQAVHPLTGEHVPVWVADYVLGGYGTGAIMAVPGHDRRDWEFARQFNLPVKPVVQATKNPRTALILHGASGNNQTGWIPWLKSELEAYGYEVIAPNLPNSAFPDLDAWLTSLEPYAQKMNEESLVIGHSLGAPAAEHFILNNNLKVGKLLLIAPTFPSMDWAEYREHHADKNAANIEQVSLVPVDWEKLSQSVSNITVFGSKDDSYIPFDKLKQHAKDNLHANFVGFDSKSHFNESAGIISLEEAVPHLTELFTGYGTLINSGEYDGLDGPTAKKTIVEALEDKGAGQLAVKYKLRDWIFSRQHYWGEPIPIVHCPDCGAVAVPEDKLPVTLPTVEHYEPTETGESPLAAVKDWVNTTCPRCSGPAQRETDTMPNWAGSSWYYLRYLDPDNDQVFASPEALKYWGMADIYLGGMEHTTLHLLYSRFWHQFLYDQGLLPTPEPYAARRGQGIVLASDGRKMSKSIGNVVNPTDIIASHGADTLRLYILFMAPYDETTSWSEDRLNGASRFVYRVWALAQDLISLPSAKVGPASPTAGQISSSVDRMTHKTIKKIHDDLANMRFNTVVSALMEYVNFLGEPKMRAELLSPDNAAVARRSLRALILLMAPVIPHMAEELWHELGEEGSVHVAAWPKYDPELIKDELLTIVVQVNGKVRSNLLAAPSDTEAEVITAAKNDSKVEKYLAAGKIVKTIYIPRKLVNFVVQ